MGSATTLECPFDGEKSQQPFRPSIAFALRTPNSGSTFAPEISPAKEKREMIAEIVRSDRRAVTEMTEDRDPNSSKLRPRLEPPNPAKEKLY